MKVALKTGGYADLWASRPKDLARYRRLQAQDATQVVFVGPHEEFTALVPQGRHIALGELDFSDVTDVAA